MQAQLLSICLMNNPWDAFQYTDVLSYHAASRFSLNIECGLSYSTVPF